MKLVAKDIYLRPLKLEDANGNYPNWFNDKEVCKYNSHGNKLYTKEMALEYIKAIQSNETTLVFAICDKLTNTHIGNISLQEISQINKSAELAIIVGERSYWGKGLAKEAGTLIMEYGFNVLNLNRIACGTSEVNLPMQKLASSLGMTQEGIRKKALHKNNQFYDVFEYAILNKNYSNIKKGI